MAWDVKNLYGIASEFYNRYIISDPGGDRVLHAGVPVLREDINTEAGEVQPASVGVLTGAIGLAAADVTYSTTQADMSAVDMRFGRSDALGRSVGVIIQPHGVHRFRVSGGAQSGMVLSNTPPATILVNSAANAGGLLVSDVNVGTVDQRGGLLIGKTGANSGFSRRITAHTANVSVGVTVPFPYPIAVGDQFYRVPFSKACQTVQLTTQLDEADGTIAYGTGGAAAVLTLYVNNSPTNNPRDELWVDTVFTDRHFK